MTSLTVLPSQTGLSVIGLPRKKILALFLLLFLLFNACTPNNTGVTREDVAKAIAVTVVATLVGAAAEAGILALTSSRILATVASMVAGGATSFMLSEYSVRCNDCSTTTTYRNIAATEGEALNVECSNPQCSRHDHGDAYLMVFRSGQQMSAMLRRCLEKLPPTCLLSTEDLGSEGVKLVWRTENAKSASLNGESVSLVGSRVVKPTETTSYVLKAMGRYGRHEDSLTVQGQPGTAVIEHPVTQDVPVTGNAQPPVLMRQTSVFVPAGQTIDGILQQELQTGETYPEQGIQLDVSRPVYVGRTVAIPSGSRIIGRVIESQRSGRVEGRARLSLAFEQLEIGSRNYRISAMPFTIEAPSTGGKDAIKVGVGAAIGAGIGAALGGKKGAARGAAAGGAAGAGAAMATRGEEVRLPPGQRMQVRLVEPIRIEVEE